MLCVCCMCLPLFYSQNPQKVTTKKLSNSCRGLKKKRGPTATSLPVQKLRIDKLYVIQDDMRSSKAQTYNETPKHKPGVCSEEGLGPQVVEVDNC